MSWPVRIAVIRGQTLFPRPDIERLSGLRSDARCGSPAAKERGGDVARNRCATWWPPAWASRYCPAPRRAPIAWSASTGDKTVQATSAAAPQCLGWRSSFPRPDAVKLLADAIRVCRLDGVAMFDLFKLLNKYPQCIGATVFIPL